MLNCPQLPWVFQDAGGTLQVRVNLEFSTHQNVREELTRDGFIKWLQTGATKGTGRSCWSVVAGQKPSSLCWKISDDKQVRFVPTYPREQSLLDIITNTTVQKHQFFSSQLSLWRRQWHPTPVLLPGKSHGWGSLEGCSPWGCWGSDMTERLNNNKGKSVVKVSTRYRMHLA